MPLGQQRGAAALRASVLGDPSISTRTKLVPYVTGGWPHGNAEETARLMMAMERAGAVAIEVGVPFSDPLADGPTIQRSSQTAIEQGVTFRHCLDAVQLARASGLHIPVVLMGYYNPLISYGEKRAVEHASAAGVDGFIVVDLPPEEATAFVKFCRAHSLAFIPFVAPTTRNERLPIILALADAFVYCVSLTGVTGARQGSDHNPDNYKHANVPTFMKRIRALAGETPLVLGFGIGSRQDVVQVQPHVDAVVVGSALIKCIEDAMETKTNIEDAVEKFIKELIGAE